ncbi:MAG: cobalamin-binding protein [Desulfobacteraceae bacterium]|nr:cobalamin-binding protein [Desulfobacteraceae bacterium]
MNNEKKLETFIKAILDGDRNIAVSETEKLLSHKISKEEIVNDGIENAMKQLDKLCTAEHFNLLQIMLAGRAVDAVIKMLFPEGRNPEKAKAKVVAGTLEGDIHDLGKNIVKKVLVANGYHVIDCGKDSQIEKIINTAKRENAVAICISGLITSVIPQVQQLKGLLQKYDIGNIAVLAGGAALKQSTSEGLEVDYVGETAFDTVHYINNLIKET